MKIILIEPNLKHHTGHVYEATKAIEKFLKESSLDYHIIGHRDLAKSKAIQDFDKISCLATASCFETKNFDLVQNYIKEIIKEFNLTTDDLIIITTAHLNELEAIASISNKENSPKFFLQIHQFYPPMLDSDMVTDLNVNLELDYKFKALFKNINWETVRVATTPSDKLNDRLSTLSPYPLESCSVAFNMDIERIIRKDYNSEEKFTVSFLGDGRKEKGLLTVLRFLNQEMEGVSDFGFKIQVQNPRGFTPTELLEITEIVNLLRSRNNIEIIESSLTTDEYRQNLTRSDAIIIPYDLNNYNARLSGITIEAGILGIPVIATKGTLTAGWIKRGELSGIVIDENQAESQINHSILTSLVSLRDLYKDHLDKALIFKEKYIKEYSAVNFMNHILYDEKTQFRPWTKLRTSEVKTRSYPLVSKTFDTFDEIKTFDVFGGNPSVHALALTKDKKVVLVRQFRPGPERVLWDLPGGGLDEGESPEDAGIRELEEETGYFGKAILVNTCETGAYFTMPKYSLIIFDCEKISEPTNSDTGFFDIKLIELDELKNLLNKNVFTMADLIAAYAGLDYLKLL